MRKPDYKKHIIWSLAPIPLLLLSFLFAIVLFLIAAYVDADSQLSIVIYVAWAVPLGLLLLAWPIAPVLTIIRSFYFFKKRDETRWLTLLLAMANAIWLLWFPGFLVDLQYFSAGW